ncbi:DUF3240 family protein [Helicobacter felis]|uniref:DUF3240 family protein n=1 Tax=Helicobacter felis TaxID=214 RepID=UPI000CED9C37|nr:DUF3240 family protein [Helicobacter felis]
MLLEIYTPSPVQDSLLDYLLEKGYTHFYLLPAFVYGTPQAQMNICEQVSGRKECALVRLFLPEQEARQLATEIKKLYPQSAPYLFSNIVI